MAPRATTRRPFSPRWLTSLASALLLAALVAVPSRRHRTGPGTGLRSWSTPTASSSSARRAASSSPVPSSTERSTSSTTQSATPTQATG